MTSGFGDKSRVDRNYICIVYFEDAISQIYTIFSTFLWSKEDRPDGDLVGHQKPQPKLYRLPQRVKSMVKAFAQTYLDEHLLDAVSVQNEFIIYQVLLASNPR